MPPAGLAILLGAGPTSGAGVARMLAQNGNLAVALLSRSITPSSPFVKSLKDSCPGATLVPFQTDTSEASLKRCFQDIKAHEEFKGLKLKLAIWHIKHSHKTPFEEETRERFESSLGTYVGGAMSFSQECIKWMQEQYPTSSSDASELQKKGTIIFTGTLGALRANIGFGAYGAGRSGVRMLAQSLAREFSPQGIQVVHTIANGGITDSGDGEDKEKVAKGQKMRAETIGKLYLWLMQQEVDLWVHELDMRPAAEKF